MILLVGLAALTTISACHKYDRPNPGDRPDSDSTFIYNEQYDAIADKGQYWIPKQKMGKDYWLVVDSRSNDNNSNNNSLRNHILAESIIGVTALAVNEGRSETMVWTQDPNSNYTEVAKRLGMSHIGNQSTWELIQHHGNVKSHIEGYILCDVNKQESISAATVAAHVYRSIIVDVEYEQRVKDLGYTIKYDAREKGPQDAWTEFKDQCNKNAMVLMPTLTGNQKGYAIAHKLMLMNLNKEYANPAAGNNNALFEEVLNSLQPLSPVLGWEQGLDEKAFVEKVSKSGNLMVPFDWAWNATMMSADYESKISGLAKVTNPQFINYDTTKSYASFLLSDGDNVMWMMNDFNNSSYYGNAGAGDINMSFGLPVANLAMLSPIQLDRLLAAQHPKTSIVEYGGGGYYYADNFAENKDRAGLLRQLADKVSHHMRQHRTKVLGLFCDDVKSEKAKEAFQAFISQNDQLTGVVAVQYTPYAGGNGDVMWFENSQGIQIPVVTVRYSIWNHGNRNNSNEGTPAYIASKLNELAAAQSGNASAVIVHAWSSFKNIGSSADLLEENNGGSVRGVDPARWCAERLSENTRVVNVEEMIWQLRMKKQPQQTTEILKKYF